MLAFLADECELGADFTVSCADMWAAAVRWREANGHRRMSSQAFGEFLRQRGVFQVRPRQEGDRLPRVYHGIRLRVQTGSGPKLVAVPDPERPIGAPKHK